MIELEAAEALVTGVTGRAGLPPLNEFTRYATDQATCAGRKDLRKVSD